MNSHQPSKTSQVLLHFGAGKTGSTAIQNMLYENRQLLSNLGINYADPRFHHNGIQSGNGDEICLRLREGASCFEVKKLLSSRIEIGKLSIISCEEFLSLSIEKLNILYESLDQLKIEFKVLIYIRNPVGFYISAYGQKVKRHGYANSFSDFLDETPWGHDACLTKLKESRLKIDFTVVSYDQTKKNLTKSFWESVYSMFGINVTKSFTNSKVIANRSLYQEEINFLLKINNLFGIKFSTLISDFFINETKFVGTQMAITQELSKKIAKRHEKDVKRINLEFFNDKPIVTIDSAEHIDALSKRLRSYPNAESLTQLLVYLMRNIEEIVESKESTDIDTVRKHLLSGKYFDPMPNGEYFDNVFYMLHNLDVVRSNEDPLTHYLSYGIKEARAWRKKIEN